MGAGLLFKAPWRWALVPLFIGFAWASWSGQAVLSQFLPQPLIKQDTIVSGHIVDLPQHKAEVSRFNFLIEQSEAGDFPLPIKIRLSWYGREVPQLETGQGWQFTVRLKPAHGSLNPGAFDYESWLFAQRIRATGYVRTKQPVVALSGKSRLFAVNAFRADLAQFIDTQVSGPRRGILAALGVGIRRDLSPTDWQLLQDTGTIHLVAISGLHLGLVAGLFYFLGSLSWRYLGLRWVPIPAQKMGAISSVLAGLVYAALAGFSIPTTRALWMLITAALILLSNRNTPLRFNFGLVLAVVLLIDPLSPLSVGFWLSFGAVAVILYASQTQQSPTPQMLFKQRVILKLKGYGLIQLAILVGLAPILLLTFQKLSLVSLLANVLAIPVVGLLVVPLVLLGMAAYAVGGLGFAQTLFSWAEVILEWLWQILEMMAHWPWAVWQQSAPPIWAVLMALIGACLLLLPRAFPGRWIGLVWMLPMVLVKPPQPEPGEAWLTVLDVGQGLASVIQTATHTLVYDVGPAYPSGYDTGKDVILPFLRHQGLGRVDALILSHDNADHIGGLQAVLDGLPVGTGWVGEPDKLQPIYPGSQACLAGTSWQWDGVGFRFLHPQPGSGFDDNNASCVLLVEAKSGSILLTGDIEKQAEARLLEANPALQVAVLLVPHHGSRTSSTAAFLDQLKPRIALITAGYWNQFHHPHKAVVARYISREIQLENTADTGALQVKLSQNKLELSRYRQQHARYWFQPVSGKKQ